MAEAPSIVDKAQALLALRDMLGEATFAQSKAALLKSSPSITPEALKTLLDLAFLTAEEHHALHLAAASLPPTTTPVATDGAAETHHEKHPLLHLWSKEVQMIVCPPGTASEGPKKRPFFLIAQQAEAEAAAAASSSSGVAAPLPTTSYAAVEELLNLPVAGEQADVELDVVFIVDCTGSMGSYIQQTQQNIIAIANEIIASEKAHLRFALVCYRDHPPQDSSYITKVFSFTDSQAEMVSYVNTMQASGGGDCPEAVASGLGEVLKLQFRPTASKIAVLIADAPPHGIGYSGDGFPNGDPNNVDPLEVIDQMAREMGVVLYTVGCEPSITGSSGAAFMRAAAERGQGRYIPLTDAKLLSTAIIGSCREELSFLRCAVHVLQSGKKATTASIVAELHQKGLTVTTLQFEDSAKATYAEQVAIYLSCNNLSELRDKLKKAGKSCPTSYSSSGTTVKVFQDQPITEEQVMRIQKKYHDQLDSILERAKEAEKPCEDLFAAPVIKANNFSPKAETICAAAEHVFFYLDISGSMLGEPLAKAKELIPYLVLQSAKRGSPVTVVPWDTFCRAPITFTPDKFFGAAGSEEEEGSDGAVLEEVRKRIDLAIGACGGTNIGAALMNFSERAAILASVGCKSVVAWLLTDGEDNTTIKGTGHKEDDVYFTEKVAGITAYQRDLATKMSRLRQSLELSGTFLHFHLCCTADAEPKFLGSLREAVGGFFHAISDISAMKGEMSAATTDARCSVTFVLDKTEGEIDPLPASVTCDGSLCCRGVLPDKVLQHIEKSKAVKVLLSHPLNLDRTLGSFQATEASEKLFSGISEVLALETALSELISSVQSMTTTSESLQKAGEGLKELSARKVAAVASVSRCVKPGSVLQVFLENVLESVQTQSSALLRLFSQYYTDEVRKYDAEASAKEGIGELREKDKLAISAGLESVRVRIGNGFVQSTFDSFVQKYVASHGARARKMLQRVCLVARTDDHKEVGSTVVTVFVLEGPIFKDSRAAILQKLLKSCSASEESGFTLQETLYHKADNESDILCKYRLTEDEAGTKVLSELELPFSEVYPAVVTKRTLRGKTTDFMDMDQRYGGLSAMITQTGTLPAALYKVGDSQAAGLVHSLERVYVISGGQDVAKMDYFRLFAKLAREGEDGLVMIPGATQPANVGMPIAPDAISHCVLANLMTGLWCEFITNTPMAPLSTAGNLYVGFLLMHMRQNDPPHTQLDIRRIAEIMASLGAWIADSYTLPKPEEAELLVANLVKDQGVADKDSVGKHIPTKAVSYALLDNKQPLCGKYSALTSEVVKRSVAQLLVASAGARKKATPELQAQQMLIKDFVRQVALWITGSSTPEAEEFNRVASLLYKLSKADGHSKEDEEVFLADEKNQRVIVKALRELLHTRGRQGFPGYAQWNKMERFFYVWAATAVSLPSEEVCKAFNEFRRPLDGEKYLAELLATDLCKSQDDTDWREAVTSWLQIVEEGPKQQIEHCVLCCGDSDDSHLAVRVTNLANKTQQVIPLASAPASMRKQALDRLWELFSKQILAIWTPPPHIPHGLDAPVTVLAVATAGSSTGGRGSRAVVAPPTKKKVPPPPPKPTGPRIDPSNHHVLRQEKVELLSDDGKSAGNVGERITAIAIGAVDAGKSTILGHLIAKLGYVPAHVLERYEKEAEALLGQPTHKYAWVMSKLRDERERGMTVQLSDWHITTRKNGGAESKKKQKEVSLIDCPGHKAFINNMAAGASLADLAVLVVSAAKGEFEEGIAKNGMTRTELLYAHTQGVKNFAVVINKMDTVGYSQERFDEVSGEVVSYITRLGIAKDKVPVLPLAGYTGENLLEAPTEHMEWFKGWTKKMSNGETVTGMTLMDILENVDASERKRDGPLRVPILKVNKIGGVGTVAIGRVASGTLKAGAKIQVCPAGIMSTVPSIEFYHNQITEAHPGDMIGFVLRGVAYKDVTRGMVVTPATEATCQAVYGFTAQIVVVDHPNGLKEGFNCYFHAHAGSFPGRITKVLSLVDTRKGTVLEDNPTEPVKVRQSAIIHVEVHEHAAVYVEPFDKCSSLGRFILRESTGTAVGKVLTVETSRPKAPPKLHCDSRYIRPSAK